MTGGIGGGDNSGLRIFGSNLIAEERRAEGKVSAENQIHPTTCTHYLYLMGIHHEQLATNRSRSFRLTDASGRVIHEIMA